MTYKQIVERLSLIRTEANLSARELGLRLGNSETYFYKIENGSIILSTPKLLEVLELLGVSTQHFFYDDYQRYEKDQELLKITKSLTSEELDSLIVLLKRKSK